MSKLLDRFRYFKQKGETFADGHGQVMHSNRDWEDSYRQRWQFDKIVRSTHGVNCTGSCSWKIYVKNGLVTWEIQQTDYPRTRPDLPNHEPRGCPRGASYSWYLYSANRLKYPLIRKRLIELWREALKQHSDPVLAWASIMNDPQKCLSYKQVRGRGGFIRSNWQELNQLIAAANVWTIKTYGPDRVAYQDHPWMRAFGESLVAYRPPIDTRSVSEMRQIPPNGFPEKALNFLTPHQKWGIHSTYSENLLMLTLSRGGPIVWISETDARELTIVDNDWVEVFNANGALTARAVVSQRVPPGMTMMYHAQERIMNIPGSEVTGMRGGIHNSVTRVCPKPTHMIGGYAQLAWGFNYYGTVGSNRDEFIMIRKMKNVNWLDDEGRDQVQEAKK